MSKFQSFIDSRFQSVVVSKFQSFIVSKFQSFKVSKVQRVKVSKFHRFEVSKCCRFKVSEFESFKVSKFLDGVTFQSFKVSRWSNVSKCQSFQMVKRFQTVKLRLSIDSTGARGILQKQGCGPLNHSETRLTRLQAKHEERQLTVIKEPTQTNTVDRFTKALQTTKYLEWRNRLSMGYDIGDDVETSKREALAESGRWARVEALHAIPRSVLIATLMQETFPTRRRGCNEWIWLSKA